MDWLKENWKTFIIVGTFIIALIVLFQTCNQEGNVIIFPDSTDRRIDRDLEESHRARTPLETNPQLIQQQNYYETINYLNLTDTLKPVKCMQFARELLK